MELTENIKIKFFKKMMEHVISREALSKWLLAFYSTATNERVFF